MENNNHTLSLNSDSCNQLNQIVISIALAAIANQDLALLKELGIDREQAESLRKMNAMSLTNLAVRARGPLFRIVPKDIFQTLIDSVSANEDADGKISKLIAIGASQPMLADLGFGVTRPEFVNHSEFTGKRADRGRPKKLTRAEIAKCHDFWNTPRGTTLSDPLNLLIETCEVFGFRASQLWEYLGPEGPRTPAMLREYSLSTPADERPWVQIMFSDRYVSTGNGYDS